MNRNAVLATLIFALIAIPLGAQTPADTAHVRRQTPRMDSVKTAMDSLARWCRATSNTSPRYLRRVCPMVGARPDLRLRPAEDSLLIVPPAPPPVALTLAASRTTVISKLSSQWTTGAHFSVITPSGYPTNQVTYATSDTAAANYWRNPTTDKLEVFEPKRSGTVTITGRAGSVTGTLTLTLIGPDATDPVPPDTTIPPPQPPSTTDMATILALLGPTKTVATTATLGAPFSTYDQVFTQYLPTVNGWADNYYDRGVAYYARYARTGDATFLTKANAITLAYRQQYLEPNNYGVQPHWSMVRGLELHYRLTGDTLSRRAVAGMFAWGGVNFTVIRANGKPEIGDTQVSYMDNRIQARVLQQLLSAYRMGASFNRGDGYGGVMGPTTWPTRLREALNWILSTQQANGSFAFSQVCGGQLNYMVGMLNDVLIEYYRTFEADPRIPTAVESSAEYLWTTQWLAADQAFSYASVRCLPNPFGTNVGDQGPAGDLNGLFIASFGWLAQRTGDPKWRTRGDAIMAGLVTPRWASNYTGSKQFNQAFAESYRYLGWRP